MFKALFFIGLLQICHAPPPTGVNDFVLSSSMKPNALQEDSGNVVQGSNCMILSSKILCFLKKSRNHGTTINSDLTSPWEFQGVYGEKNNPLNTIALILICQRLQRELSLFYTNDKQAQIAAAIVSGCGVEFGKSLHSASNDGSNTGQLLFPSSGISFELDSLMLRILSNLYLIPVASIWLNLIPGSQMSFKVPHVKFIFVIKQTHMASFKYVPAREVKGERSVLFFI